MKKRLMCVIHLLRCHPVPLVLLLRFASLTATVWKKMNVRCKSNAKRLNLLVKTVMMRSLSLSALFTPLFRKHSSVKRLSPDPGALRKARSPKKLLTRCRVQIGGALVLMMTKPLVSLKRLKSNMTAQKPVLMPALKIRSTSYSVVMNYHRAL